MSAIEVAGFGLEDRDLVARYDSLFDSLAGAYVQQSTGWARAIRTIGPDRPIFLLASMDGRDVAGLPLYLFEAPPGAILTSIPQPGPLGGIFARPELDAGAREAAYAALLGRAIDLAMAERCLTFSLITDPLQDDLALYERHLAPDLVLENFTQMVPLGQIFEADRIVLPRYHRRGGFRYQLRRALAHGFTVRAAERPGELESWYAVHVKRSDELDAAPLPLDLLLNLLRELGPAERAKLWLIEKDGQLAGGSLLVRHLAVVDVYAVSMDSAFAPYAPNYVLADHALRWARGIGASWLNWQSSPSRASGVYAFKARWGAEERSYSFLSRRFCAPDRLAALGADGVKRYYPNHFVAPFGAFAEGCRGGRYRKD